MKNDDMFDLTGFTPYLLNLAAETSSLSFQASYKDRYGMLRTEWRVLFHLGRYGAMTAKEVCARSRTHKTKVSRAVSALEQKRFLTRTQVPEDRRHERLELTKPGKAAYNELSLEARRFDDELMAQFSADDVRVLRRCLAQIAGV